VVVFVVEDSCVVWLVAFVVLSNVSFDWSLMSFDVLFDWVIVSLELFSTVGALVEKLD